RILKRAKNTCEFDGCDFKNGETVFSVKYKGRTQAWYRNKEEAYSHTPISLEVKKGVNIPNPKPVKVVLTIAHLDHDEENHNVTDDRLKAACQLCHLRYDAREKYRRILKKQQ
ncbi:unnamed protein product, partial [marine sediment metagenome]